MFLLRFKMPANMANLSDRVITQPLAESINVRELPGFVINSKETPAQIRVRPVVGGEPEEVMTLDQFRTEYPLLRCKMIFARELFEATNPGDAASMGTGPTFEELLEFAGEYVDTRVQIAGDSEKRDIGIYFWSRKALDILETAIRRLSRMATLESREKLFRVCCRFIL